MQEACAMEQIEQLWLSISNNLVDILVYTAIALVTVVGFFKCIFPVRRSARCLRRAVRTLDKLPARDSMRPVWQNELFMGKKMRPAWRRFLVNAEQLDARGLSCDVRDYISDDTAIYECGNIPLGELIPGLLTSLGILGTFIGLMRGLGGLDVSDAAKTMESIPAMIGGMTFAFATSIAGVACSLAFNMINRMSLGSATRALDDFQEAFTELVMQTPLEEDTQAICQREDQTAFLRHAVGDIGDHMADKVSLAVEGSLTPVTQAMNNFILGQTQAQMDGVAVIAQRFVETMNASLSGQFVQLGKTLSQINRSQQASFDAVDRSMATADQVIANLSGVQQVTQEIAGRFESYVRLLSEGRKQEDEFSRTAGDVVASLSRMAREQNAQLEEVKKAQADVQSAISDYALRSKQTMQLICDRADESGKAGSAVAKEMKDSGKLLKDSYASFVENISSGLAKTMGMFDENMNDLMNALQKRLSDIKGTAGSGEQVVASLARLEQALSGIEEALKADDGKREA